MLVPAWLDVTHGQREELHQSVRTRLLWSQFVVPANWIMLVQSRILLTNNRRPKLRSEPPAWFVRELLY